jgi:hypothetical protein
VIAILLFYRVTFFFAVSSYLGPKTIMIGRMMKDLLGFCIFVFLLMCGFGIAIFAVRHPEAEFDFRTLISVVYRPYFQIFGEMNLDTYQQESGCVGEWEFSSCGSSRSWLIPIFVGIYAMLTQVLLVNLLIAIFNATYTEVQADAKRLWRFQRYQLFVEFTERKVIVGPTLVMWGLTYGLMLLLELRAHRWTGKQKKNDDDYRRIDHDQVVRLLADIEKQEHDSPSKRQEIVEKQIQNIGLAIGNLEAQLAVSAGLQPQLLFLSHF